MPSTRLAWVYILLCSDGTFYTGWTWDPKKRARQHNNGRRGSKYVAARRPAALVYVAPFESQSLAMRAEAAIRKLTHTQKEKLVGDFIDLVENDGMMVAYATPAPKRSIEFKWHIDFTGGKGGGSDKHDGDD